MQSGSPAIFGAGGDEVTDESTTPSGLGPREMVTVCLAWEAPFRQATAGGAVEPAVHLRIGIGLGGEGDPATARLAQLVRLGLGGQVASGPPVGVVGGPRRRAGVHDPGDRRAGDARTDHVTSSNPVTNAEMMATYRRFLGRRVGLPSPALVTRLGAPLLGSSASLALTGRRCVPARLVAEGFAFSQPGFELTARRALARLRLLPG